MTEEAVRNMEADQAGAVPGEASAGRLLRQAREATGVHIASLAVALKVPVGKLEALESDRYSDLPDAVFTRALASSMCRALKVDAAPVLERLPQGQPPRLSANSAGLNTAFKDSHAKTTVALGNEGSASKVKFAVIALLVAAVVVYVLPRDAIESLRMAVSAMGSAPSQEAGAASETVTESAATVAAVPTPAPAHAPQMQGLMAEPAQASVSSGAVPEAGTAAVASADSVAPAVAVLAPSSGEVKPAPAAGEGVLEFRATEESWVQVRDASGAVTFQRSLTPGEVVTAPGRPPLSVVVGKVHATQVFVRGAPFDLAPVARENVARFEVK